MKKNPLIFTIILFIFFISILLSLLNGSVSIPFYQLLFSLDPPNDAIFWHAIFWEIRLPRVLTALTAGGLLALSGAFMQLLLQNPLADPYVLGVSSGAALVSIIFMLLGGGAFGVQCGAWLGSLSAILLVLLLAKKHRFQPYFLLLTGVALASTFSAGIGCLLFITTNAELHSLLFWLAGDLAGASIPYGGIGILGIGLLLAYLLAPGMNILARGRHEAKALGLSHGHYQVILYLLSSALTAEAVTLVGCIGFIGLIVPHATRLIIGHDHRVMLPMSVLLGGTLLVDADTLSRVLIAPVQLPIGMVMALLGLPVFIWLMQR